MNAEEAIFEQICIDSLISHAAERGLPDGLCDGIEEFRCSGVEAPELKCPYSRHYESQQVVKQLDSGKWVSWTYWYGGGKWGWPESMDWMSDAYFVDCEKEEKVTTVRKFTKVKNIS